MNLTPTARLVCTLGLMVMNERFLCLPVAAQVRSVPHDSTELAVTDSTKLDSLYIIVEDSLKIPLAQPVPAKPPVFFSLPETNYEIESPRRSDFIFQDFVQLGWSALPISPLVGGEFGQPRYLAAGYLPPRVTETLVDSVLWLPGVYGTSDYVSLPEAGVDVIDLTSVATQEGAIGNGPLQISMRSDSLNFAMPFSDIEYVNGALGADAVRVGFGRAFSRKLVGFLNGTFDNRAGQFGEARYDGQKIGLKLDYLFGSRWYARYRQFNTSSETGVAVPFFPEEWPAVSSALHKEVRVYHALEAGRSRSLLVRAFHWQIKEELNDNSRKIPHHLREAGLEAIWQWHHERFGLNLHPRVARETLDSPTINYAPRTYGEISASLALRLFTHDYLQVAGSFKRKSEWPEGFSMSLSWQRPWRHGKLWARAGENRLPPAAGERENSLSSFGRNSDLAVVTLRHLQAGGSYDNQRLKLQATAGVAQWRDGYVLQLAAGDSTARLINSVARTDTYGGQLATAFRLTPVFTLGALGAGSLYRLPNHYWFWYQLENHARFYLESRFRTFANTVEIYSYLAARYIGSRSSPAFVDNQLRAELKRLSPLVVWDFQIRLQTGDAAVFLAIDNILNEQFRWRNEVPDVGRAIRWGFWWTFLN